MSPRDDSELFTIQYQDVKYGPGTLIPIKLGSITENAYTDFVLQFHCKSICQPGSPFHLGMIGFTRNIPSEIGEEQYGVHQEKASANYPIIIQ